MSTETGTTPSDPEVFAGGPNSPEELVTPVAETSEPKVFDADYVKQLREEAAKHRVEKQAEAKRNEALLAKLTEFENSQLTESERNKKEFDETRTRADVNETRAREAELKYQIALAARDEKITDIKAAVKLADRGLIEYDDDGGISNLSDVVTSLRSEYPSLFNPNMVGAPNTGVTNPAKTPSAKKYTREDIKKMSNERRVELLESGELRHLL